MVEMDKFTRFNYKLRRNIFILVTTVAMFVFSGCKSAENLTYLANVTSDTTVAVSEVPDIIIQSNDLLRIYVASQTPEATIQFNQETNRIATTVSGTQTNSSNANIGYRVDGSGDIIFPVLGKIHVAGLTHHQLAMLIENRLISEGHIKDPVVTVNLMNFTISIVGEVMRPGQVLVDGDRITIFEALSKTGDISLYGIRDKVFIIREQEGKRMIATLDLTSKDIFSSPYYYLCPNDIVYVEPNKAKKRLANNNAALTMSWISAGVSLLSTISMMVYYYFMTKHIMP